MRLGVQQGFADEVDHMFAVQLVALSIIAAAVFTLVIAFCVRFRRRPGHLSAMPTRDSYALEVLWTSVATVIAIAMFAWGTPLFGTVMRIPKDAYEVFVVGKQWMWKLQHPGGRREINVLHVPVGRPIVLSMTSKDVIHSLYLPAFRVKADVYPSRTTKLWFTAPRPGEYHMFCAEFCGAGHAAMRGRVVAMEAAAFTAWTQLPEQTQSPEETGSLLFAVLGCSVCHGPRPARGPSLVGLAGSRVRLADGTVVDADERYLRESILDPGAAIVAGYDPVMPSYANSIDDEQLAALTAYIRSLGRGPSGDKRPR